MAQEGGWETIFDGKTLKGWDGDPKFWSVEDGSLTGTTTKENPTQGNTFAIWTGGEPGDFELKLQYKIVGGNSGIQYRSFRLPNAQDKWRVGGYQADIDSGDRYSGILYGEQFRGILADRGLITTLNEEGKPTTVGTLGDSKAIQAKIKKEDWNDYLVVAKGNHFSHFINGVQTSECTDNDTDTRRASGLLALQLHAGPPMKIQFRNIQIKRSGGKTAAASGHGGRSEETGPRALRRCQPAHGADLAQWRLCAQDGPPQFGWAEECPRRARRVQSGGLDPHPVEQERRNREKPGQRSARAPPGKLGLACKGERIVSDFPEFYLLKTHEDTNRT